MDFSFVGLSVLKYVQVSYLRAFQGQTVGALHPVIHDPRGHGRRRGFGGPGGCAFFVTWSANGSRFLFPFQLLVRPGARQT